MLSREAAQARYVRFIEYERQNWCTEFDKEVLGAKGEYVRYSWILFLICVGVVGQDANTKYNSYHTIDDETQLITSFYTMLFHQSCAASDQFGSFDLNK